jgi:predicted Zn finger-like uncharacterized protein
MKIKCNSCEKVYEIDDSKLPTNTIRVKCKKCNEYFLIPGKNISEEMLSIRAENQDELANIDNRKDATINDNIVNASNDEINKEKEIATEGLLLEEDVKNKNAKNKKEMLQRKTCITGLILFVLFTIQCHSVRSIVYENRLIMSADKSAEEQIDISLKRSGITYATARAINAGIAVVKNSALNLNPAGVGVTLAIGEALEPIDDLIERFSWVMLASMVSLGIQKIFIHVGPWISLYILLTIGLVFLLIGTWTNGNIKNTIRVLSKKCIFAAVIVRFALPIIGYLNEQTYELFLSKQYESTQKEISEAEALITKSTLNDFLESNNQPAQDEGIISKTKNLLKEATSISKIKDKINSFKLKLEQHVEKLIQQAVVFILNTIIFPIVYLWGFIKFAKYLLGGSFYSNVEETFREKIFQKNNYFSAFPKKEAGSVLS